MSEEGISLKKSTLKSLDVDVINFILHNNDATIEELCNCFNVSPVNIRTVLSRIETFTSDNDLGKLLKNGGHYFFENNNLNLDFDYTEFAQEDIEKKERTIYIILKLIFENSINLTSISKELNISRITLNSDLEFIKEIIEDFQLKLVSIQWKGVFLEGDLLQLQKFSILFIAKLYIEEYFKSNLKKVINPVLYAYFRKFITVETEDKIFSIANKLYQYFGIKLGVYHYYILISIITFIYICRKNGLKLYSEFENLQSNFDEALEDLLDIEDKKLIGEDYSIINIYLSNCIQKKYSIPISHKVVQVLDEFYSILNIKDNGVNFEILSFFINNLYFENRFFISNYIRFDKDDENILNDEVCINIIKIFEKYNIPYNKKDIAFLYNYIHSTSTEVRKKSILIIDSSTLIWKGNKLKEKLKYSEKINSINVISYFNFKLFPIETHKKYDIFLFIDLPNEKKEHYPNKITCFINSYALIKNMINFDTFFEN